jgi:hypothetical protein
LPWRYSTSQRIRGSAADNRVSVPLLGRRARACRLENLEGGQAARNHAVTSPLVGRPANPPCKIESPTAAKQWHTRKVERIGPHPSAHRYDCIVTQSDDRARSTCRVTLSRSTFIRNRSPQSVRVPFFFCFFSVCRMILVHNALAHKNLRLPATVVQRNTLHAGEFKGYVQPAALAHAALMAYWSRCVNA